MKQTRVYDWPTRIFHGLFALGFPSIFFIAKTFDDDSALFPVHMLLGMTLVFLVALRFIWGFLGSRYSRFTSFPLHPKDLLAYTKGLFHKNQPRFLGHNPASGWAALIMMALVLGLGTSGYFMVSGSNKEFFEEIHEVFAHALLVVALLHIAGVAVHSMKHRDSIALSMIHGYKKSVDGKEAIPHSHFGVGLALLGIMACFSFYIAKGYNSDQRSLSIFGNTLSLGEVEEHSDSEMDPTSPPPADPNHRDGNDRHEDN